MSSDVYASPADAPSPAPAPADPPFGARVRTIFALAVPIVGAMASQNVLNLVDSAFVGQFGDAAQSAVGFGGFLNFLATAFLTAGGSAAVQATAARRVGEGRKGEVAVSLNGGLLLVTAGAIPWSLLLIGLTPIVYPYLNHDPAVQALGIPYLQWRLVAMVAMAANFCFRGFWSGIGRSGMYLQTLLVMHASNLVLCWALIFGHLGLPAMGPVGSAIANTVATFLGLATYAVLGWREPDAREGGFLTTFPSADVLRGMLKLAVPAGIQQTFFAAGMVALSAIVGAIGTAELAATQVMINVMLVGVLPALGLGIAAASLVGQALGRKQPLEARRWGWDVVKVAVVVVAVLGLPMLAAPRLVLTPFLTDPATRELAAWPLRLTGVGLLLDAVGLVLLNALIGAGDTRTAMRVNVALQWGVALPAAAVVGPVLGGGLLAVWITQMAQRLLQAAIVSYVWQRGKWMSIKV